MHFGPLVRDAFDGQNIDRRLILSPGFASDGEIVALDESAFARSFE